MKNLQFFQKFSMKFRDFPPKFYLIFGENLDKNLEICICRGFGGGNPPPDASEFMEIWVEKSMEILPFFQFFKEFYPEITPII